MLLVQGWIILSMLYGGMHCQEEGQHSEQCEDMGNLAVHNLSPRTGTRGEFSNEPV